MRGEEVWSASSKSDWAGNQVGNGIPVIGGRKHIPWPQDVSPNLVPNFNVTNPLAALCQVHGEQQLHRRALDRPG